MSGAAPLRVVLDTNVLLDLWLFDDPSAQSLRTAIESGVLRPLRSRDCDAEFDNVLAREQFGLDEAARTALLQRWSACSEAIPWVAPAPITCTDPDDQKFLDAAFSAAADCLITRDRALLRLARRAEAAGLRILSPASPMTYDPSQGAHLSRSLALAGRKIEQAAGPAAYRPTDADRACKREGGASRQ